MSDEVENDWTEVKRGLRPGRTRHAKTRADHAEGSTESLITFQATFPSQSTLVRTTKQSVIRMIMKRSQSHTEQWVHMLTKGAFKNRLCDFEP